MKMLVMNPATLETVAELTIPDSDAVEEAVGLSSEAFGLWKNRSWAERQEALLKIAAGVEAERERLAILLTAEQGKPLHESRREIAAFSDVFRFYAGMGRPVEVVRDDDSITVSSAGEPYGPCALILPCNYPVGILGWKLAPCLLAGNTALAKPSPNAPLTVIEVVKIASNCLPENTAQALPGDDETGRNLVSRKEINRISFTGSREAGRDILTSGAARFARVTLEMGGNDAAIITKGCDLSKRLDSMFWGCFFNAGQICVAIKRIYAHESLAPELVRRFKEKAEGLAVGNGLEHGTEMGPMNNERQLLKVEELVSDALDRGATLVCGGSRYKDRRKTGYFYRPTVMTDIGDGAPLVTEEQFGPAIPILTYTDLDEAVARANATDYGLGGSVWTEDLKKGLEIASRLECGTAWVNAHMLVEHAAPFGGVKASGLGRELGRHGLEEFLQPKTTYLRK